MNRRLLAAAAAVVAVACTWTAAAAAAVPPGTYKGSLYLPSGAKIAGAPVTLTIVASKLTIKAPKLPIKCRDAAGGYSQPSDPIAYEYRATMRTNTISGPYISPLAGSGEFFLATVVYASDTRSFSGKLAFSGKCKGSASFRATKA